MPNAPIPDITFTAAAEYDELLVAFRASILTVANAANLIPNGVGKAYLSSEYTLPRGRFAAVSEALARANQQFDELDAFFDARLPTCES